MYLFMGDAIYIYIYIYIYIGGGDVRVCFAMKIPFLSFIIKTSTISNTLLHWLVFSYKF